MTDFARRAAVVVKAEMLHDAAGCYVCPPTSRYPAPATVELVTIWKRGQQAVLSVTADGKVHDFHLPPARLVYLLREVAEQLAENSILK